MQYNAVIKSYNFGNWLCENAFLIEEILCSIGERKYLMVESIGILLHPSSLDTL